MKYFVIGCLLLSAGWLQGQNLIPNGDFELGPDSSSVEWLWWTDSICGGADTLYGPDFWSITSGTPDKIVHTDPYFLTHNCWDTIFAQSGNTYVMFGAQFSGTFTEAAKTTLSFPLEKDSTYRLSCYLARQWFAFANPFYLEIRFDGGDTIITPIVSTRNWQYFDTIFIASATSIEIEIGAPSGSPDGIVAIDSLSLTKANDTWLPKHHEVKTEINMYPNPSSGFVHFDYSSDSHINVYNALGKQVRHYTLPKAPGTATVDFSDLPGALYYVQIKTDQKTINKKLLLTR